ALTVLAGLALRRLEHGPRPSLAGFRWFEWPFRALATVVAAPFLLFAARPATGPLVPRAGLAIFPHLLAAGFLPMFAASFKLDNYFLAFSAYAWLGCGLLYVLAPGPNHPKWPLIGALPLAPKWPFFLTAGFLAIPLVPLSAFVWRPLAYIAGGDLFVRKFDWRYDVGALDQTTLHKALFLSAWFALILIPYIFTARWAADRSTRRGYLAFAVPAACLMLCPLTFLIIGSWVLGQYVHEMGLTPKRVIAFAYVVCAFTAAAATFFLIFRRNKSKEPLPSGH
ncbi:MAG: hypothetical protein NTZ09_14640, partial [Candidatus Hydrogenedentes bacterium]|nr:hypothetical protein [Candidatus Hydrogenedentota bacterium]